MTFQSYYINLEKDKERNQNTIQELKKTNLQYQRFSAIDGKSIDKDKLVQQKMISNACKYFCTDKMIGCGVSHLMLYKHLQKTDTNSFALILEDDIIVTEPDIDYNAEITKIVNTYNVSTPSWNIIRLHSMVLNMGSNAAYVVNMNHIHELSTMILHYHIDLQQSFLYNIINLNTLFNTRDHMIDYTYPHDNIYVDNQKVGFYMNTHLFQILYYIIMTYHVMYFIIVLLLLYLMRFLKRKKHFIFTILFILIVYVKAWG